MQAEQGPRIAWMADEIVAEHAFGLRGSSRSQQRRPERFTDWIEPDRRLVVRQTVGGSYSIRPRGDCGIVLATRFCNARIEHDAGNRDDGTGALQPAAAK